MQKINFSALLLALLIVQNDCHAQPSNSFQPYLFAIFANNANTIQHWYTAHFGFTIKDHKNITEEKIKFYLLQKDSFLLEIIQRSEVFNTQNVKRYNDWV